MIDRDNARAFLERVGARFDDDRRGSRVTEKMEAYAEGSKEHPYFSEMKRYVAERSRQLLGPRLPSARAIEVGAGGGNLSETLVELPFASLVISDLDAEDFYVERLRKNFGGRPNVTVEQRDLTLPQKERDAFDVVYSCAVDHHVSFDQKPQFFRNILSILRPGGFYISADVLLTGYDINDPSDRMKSVSLFHAVIVDEVLRQGTSDEPARISYRAWRNEIDSFDEYKVSPSIYDDALRSAGFDVLEMTKLGPNDQYEHGVYVSVFVKPNT